MCPKARDDLNRPTITRRGAIEMSNHNGPSLRMAFLKSIKRMHHICHLKSCIGITLIRLGEIHEMSAVLIRRRRCRNAYNMVLHKAGNQLYDGTKKFIKEFLEDKVTHRLVPTIHSTQDIMQGKLFLDELKSLWNDHLLCLGMTRDILMYLVS